MHKIAEASLPDAMKFAFDNFIKDKNLDPRGLLAYRPMPKNKEDKDSASWYRDNPTTGIIYLDKHPNAREAWVLVKFERRKDAKLGQHTIAHDNVKITTPEEFKEFFGVDPAPDFDFASDMTIFVRWNKERVTNTNVNRDFDETAPHFFMYTNHRRVNLDRLIKRLYRINDILDTDPNAIVGGVFSIPYSATDIH